MKERVRSLDGLRGFAALSVLLSHVGFDTTTIINSPILKSIYQLISAGPDSVQILFVLSGFLMASLYPSISNIKEFIQKRYARIFPVYGVIILYLWIAVLEQKVTIWYMQTALLLGIALATHIAWIVTKKRFSNIGNKIFWTFVSLQVLVLLINLFLTPKIFNLPNASGLYKNSLYALTDLTLTTPFTKEFRSILAVFWSLAPEVMFYISYPFIVLPLIQISRKWGTIASILVVVAITKILLDLDTAFVSFAGMQVINIARAEGFVVGVVIGTIYLSKGKIWNSLEPFFANTFTNIAVLCAFLFVQWADSNVRDSLPSTGMNWYFIISSWVIGSLLVAALINNSIINRIFRNKVFVFLGVISYSLYLIHIQVITWVNSFFSQIGFQISTGINSLIFLVTSLGFSIIIAFALYQIIETLYFKSKLEKKQRKSLSINESKTITTNNNISIRYISISFCAIILILLLSYSGGYSSSLLLARHNVSNISQTELLSREIDIPVSAPYSNLSILSIHLDYKKGIGETGAKAQNPSKLIFQLFDEKHTLISSSERSARQVEGEPRFPFGFPILTDSKGKKYTAVLTFKGKDNEKIFIDTSSSSIVSIYTNTTPGISKLVQLFINRITFVITNLDALFAIGFFTLLIIGVHLTRKIRTA